MSVGGKGGRCVGLTILPPSGSLTLNSWSRKVLSRPYIGVSFTFYLILFTLYIFFNSLLYFPDTWNLIQGSKDCLRTFVLWLILQSDDETWGCTSFTARLYSFVHHSLQCVIAFSIRCCINLINMYSDWYMFKTHFAHQMYSTCIS
jgi:hypothetical protein